MMNYEWIALAIIAIVLFLDIFVKPKLKNVLTNEQIELIDYACEKGVEFAEQMYKNGHEIDRLQVSMDFALDVIVKSGIVSERYMDIIEAVIESKVFNLPKTH